MVEFIIGFMFMVSLFVLLSGESFLEYVAGLISLALVITGCYGLGKFILGLF